MMGMNRGGGGGSGGLRNIMQQIQQRQGGGGGGGFRGMINKMGGPQPGGPSRAMPPQMSTPLQAPQGLDRQRMMAQRMRGGAKPQMPQRPAPNPTGNRRPMRGSRMGGGGGRRSMY